jgi:stage III sporulation protein AD
MIVKLVAIGIIAALLCTILRKYHPEAALVTALLAGLILFAMTANDLKNIFQSIQGIAEDSGLPISHLTLLFKVLGISYLAQFASSIAADAGETSIAQKIEFTSKISILALSSPLFLSLIRMIVSLLP